MNWIKRLLKAHYEYIPFTKLPERGERFWKLNYKGEWESHICRNILPADNGIYFYVGTAWACTELHNCYKRKLII